MPVHHGGSALERLDGEHDELCRAAGVPLTGQSTWMRAVLETQPVDAVYVELENGGVRVAGLPLAVRRGPLVTAVEAPGPAVTDSHWFPARTPDAARALAREVAAFLHSLPRWQLQVDSAPVHDPCLRELAALLPRHRVEPGDGMPRLVIGADRSIGRYLSKSARYQARRAVRLATERGLEVATETTREPAAVRDALPDLMDLHRRRDLALGRLSDIDQPRFAALFARLIAEHADRGAVQLHTVRFDGRLAAYNLVFLDGSAARLWDARMDSEYADLGPGRLSNVRTVEAVLSDPSLTELDFMRGEEDYKRIYTNDVVPTVDFWAWSGPVPQAWRRGYETARELKRRSPALTRTWRQARSLARAARGIGPSRAPQPDQRGGTP